MKKKSVFIWKSPAFLCRDFTERITLYTFAMMEIYQICATYPLLWWHDSFLPNTYRCFVLHLQCKIVIVLPLYPRYCECLHKLFWQHGGIWLWRHSTTCTVRHRLTKLTTTQIRHMGLINKKLCLMYSILFVFGSQFSFAITTLMYPLI